MKKTRITQGILARSSGFLIVIYDRSNLYEPFICRFHYTPVISGWPRTWWCKKFVFFFAELLSAKVAQKNPGLYSFCIFSDRQSLSFFFPSNLPGFFLASTSCSDPSFFFMKPRSFWCNYRSLTISIRDYMLLLI